MRPAVSAPRPRPTLTNRQVWALALPIILSNLTGPLMGAVDTAMMGHLPDPAYIGGVALGALIFNYLYWSFGFLRMATTGFVAQAKGAGDEQELRHVTARGALLALAIGALLIALQAPLADLALALLEGSARVKGLARDYLVLRIWGAPAALFTYVAIGWLIGMAQMRAVLVLAAAQNAINAVLAVWFVAGLGWGIEGVAGATLIAEIAGALVAAVMLVARHRGLAGRWLDRAVLDRARLAGMVRVNRDIFLRTLCLLTAFAWFVSQGAAQGDVVLAANAVLMTLVTAAAYALDAFAHAAETLAGGAIGASDRRGFRHVVRMTTLSAVAAAGAVSLLYALFGPSLIALLTTLASVRDEAARYLPWAALYPFVAVWCFQLDGVYIGATRTVEMRNGMALALLFLLALGYALMPAFGNHGLWAAFLAFAAFRGAILALWYPRLMAQLH